MKKYLKNLWKNYVNTNDPGTFVTAEKMNNIENGIDAVTLELDVVEGNLGISGARVQGEAPDITSIVITSDANNYIFAIIGDSQENHLSLNIDTNDNKTIGNMFAIEVVGVFEYQVLIPIDNLIAYAETELVCSLKNVFDEEVSDGIAMILPLP